MKKHGPKRRLETKYLYCNKHGDCEHVESGIKVLKWKCCACSVEYSSNYRKRMKIKAVNYLGGSCMACGYNECVAALAFHHRNPLFKDFGLGGTGVSKRWKELQEELDKCDLLCSNCHIKLHFDEDNKEFNKIVFKTDYHRKEIHKINAKKLGKKPSL